MPEQHHGTRPRDAEHAWHWLYERAEDAFAAGLSLDDALDAVRSGFSSADFDEWWRRGER